MRAPHLWGATIVVMPSGVMAMVVEERCNYIRHLFMILHDAWSRLNRREVAGRTRAEQMTIPPQPYVMYR
ncbi:MAG: hypothetical protein JW892_11430 [Anaerolineae bacterium]|nr:hypothetical protein [Anaerolineae bacterium]